MTCENYDVLNPISGDSYVYDCGWATLKIEGSQVKIHFAPSTPDDVALTHEEIQISAQIDKIKELATMLTPVSDIAVLMDVDERRLREIISDKSHPASIAYRKGKAERALQIRQNELELAEAGSPLAVQLVGSYIRDMDSDEDL